MIPNRGKAAQVGDSGGFAKQTNSKRGKGQNSRYILHCSWVAARYSEVRP